HVFHLLSRHAVFFCRSKLRAMGKARDTNRCRRASSRPSLGAVQTLQRGQYQDPVPAKSGSQWVGPPQRVQG
ncbi:hypothetical protein, partial [Syntrophothermus sp.]|uniref:hypothetical protein n=1 Tax=Syntrophothermus sp. TaxID=2736299 RepID=UPI00257F6092